MLVDGHLALIEIDFIEHSVFQVGPEHSCSFELLEVGLLYFYKVLRLFFLSYLCNVNEFLQLQYSFLSLTDLDRNGKLYIFFRVELLLLLLDLGRQFLTFLIYNS